MGPLDFHETSCPNTNARSNICFSPGKKKQQHVVCHPLFLFHFFPLLNSAFLNNSAKKKNDHRLRKRPPAPKIRTSSASPTSRIHVRNHVHSIPFTELPILKLLVSGEVSPPGRQLGAVEKTLRIYRTMGVS